MIFHCSYDKLLKINDKQLIPNPKNPNIHTDEQIERLAKIIEYQGQRRPVIISKRSGFITAGHGRLKAIQRLGWDKVAVDFQDYEDETQEYADMVADNAIAEWSSLDLSAINLELPDLGPELNIDLLGIKNFTIEPMEKYDSDDFDPNAEWDGMPEFNQEDKTSFRHVIVHFKNEVDAKEFFERIGQNDTGETKSIWFPPQERMDTESKRY